MSLTFLLSPRLVLLSLLSLLLAVTLTSATAHPAQSRHQRCAPPYRPVAVTVVETVPGRRERHRGGMRVELGWSLPALTVLLVDTMNRPDNPGRGAGGGAPRFSRLGHGRSGAGYRDGHARSADLPCRQRPRPLSSRLGRGSSRHAEIWWAQEAPVGHPHRRPRRRARTDHQHLIPRHVGHGHQARLV